MSNDTEIEITRPSKAQEVTREHSEAARTIQPYKARAAFPAANGIFGASPLKRQGRIAVAYSDSLDLLLCVVCFAVVHAAYLGSLNLIPERLAVLLAGPCLLWCVLLAGGLHCTNTRLSLPVMMSRVFVCWCTALATLGLLMYLTKLAEPVSRGWVGLSMVACLLAITLHRLMLFAFQFSRISEQTTSVVLVGTPELSDSVLRTIDGSAHCQTDIVAVFSSDCSEHSTQGSFKTLLALIENHRKNAHPIDEVWIAVPATERVYVNWLCTNLQDSAVDVCIVPDAFEMRLVSGSRKSLGQFDVVNISDVQLPAHAERIKRPFDLILTSVGLVFLAPAMALIALIVRIDSPGPVLFKQKRFGLDGQEIDIWKFRSMYHTACPDADIRQAKLNDRRVTRVGRFLRRSSLDELPQLINVLQGRMSLVGPRPHATQHSQRYRQEVAGYMLRHKIKPGITGWAQVNGWRGETDTLHKMKMRVEFDLAYMRNWSIWLDLRILQRTIATLLTDRNAY